MKILILFILCIFGFAALVMAYLFASKYNAKLEDFEVKTVTLKGDVLITQDEYRTENTSLGFLIEEDQKEYTLAGKLLKIAETSIYQLKSGDKVRIWIKKEKTTTFFDRFLKHKDSIWGIKSLSGNSFLSFEKALEHQTGVSSLIFAGLFLLMAAFSFFYAYKKM